MADHAWFGHSHAATLFWCALITIFNGCDLAIAGITLPSTMKDVGVTPTSAGSMVSVALFGVMFGAIFLSTITDRTDRRWAIAVHTVLFSIFTAAAGFSTDPITFSVTCFLTGLSIGGMMPNVVVQMAKHSPRRARNTLVTLMLSGYSVGGMLAALLSKGLLEHYGQQSMFIAAVLSVLPVPAILRQMPESMSFLLRTGKLDAVRDTVRRLSPNDTPQPGDTFIPPEADRGNDAPLGKLFQDRHGFSTAMSWIASFMCPFMVYTLSSQLTKLTASAGYSLGSALIFVLMLNFGAMFDAIGDGWLADRFSIKHVLMAMYALAMVSIALLGTKTSTGALYLLATVADGYTINAQTVTYAYAGQFYPMSIRPTGIGWASSVGRNGAAPVPIVIDILVGMALPLHRNFSVTAMPVVIVTIAMTSINHQRSTSIVAR